MLQKAPKFKNWDDVRETIAGWSEPHAWVKPKFGSISESVGSSTENILNAIDLCNRFEAVPTYLPENVYLMQTGAIRFTFWIHDHINVLYTFRLNGDFFAIRTIPRDGIEESEYEHDVIHPYTPTRHIKWLHELDVNGICSG